MCRVLVVSLLLFAPAWAEEGVVDTARAAAGATGTPAADPPPETAQDLEWAIEGYLQFHARLRTVGSETDVDLFVDVVADAIHRGRHTFRARLNGRLVADVAGDQQPNDRLRDVWDAFDHDVQFRLYEGYGEIERLMDDLLTLRVGRQFIDEGVYLHFDGLRADFRLSDVWEGLDLAVLGGIPVRFGEPSRADNWLAGAVARTRVGERTTVRLEYYHVSERFEGINDPVVDPVGQPVSIPGTRIDDDLAGLSVWHRLLDTLRVFGRFTLLNWNANEIHIRVRWFTKDGRWTVVGDLYELLGRLENVTNDLTPYTPLLGAYDPFFRIGARVTRRFGEDWVVQGGFSHRELDDERDEGRFNHEYNHYYASASRLGLLDGRLDVTLLANGYAATGNDVVAAGGHVDVRVREDVTLSGGVDYALFKYDWFQDTEREDVWTYSVRIQWDPTKDVRVVGGVTVDDDRFDTYTTVYVRVRVRF